tara:strand:+ start:345 stop:1187 length:843 start_codon:yes stop_codon:yes gene_type:complete
MTSENKDLIVREVKNLLPPIELPREIDERLPQVPFVCSLIQKVRSGKSNLIANLLLGEAFYGGQTPIFDMIYIISPTAKIDRTSQVYFKKEYEDRIVIFDDVEHLDPYISNILSYQAQFDIKSEDPDERPPLICIVLDDISGYLKRSKITQHLFTRYRHYGIGGIFVANQTCRDLPTQVRSMSTAVILSNCYSVMERQKINEEWGDTFRNRLEPVWNECCKERFNYCYLQLDVDVPKIYRIGKDPIVEIDYMKFGEVLPDQIKKLNSHEENMNLPEINKK